MVLGFHFGNLLWWPPRKGWVSCLRFRAWGVDSKMTWRPLGGTVEVWWGCTGLEGYAEFYLPPAAWRSMHLGAGAPLSF